MRKLLNKPWFVVLLAGGAAAAVWFSLAPSFQPSPAGQTVTAPAEPDPQVTTEPSADAPAATSPATETIKQPTPPKAPRDPFAVNRAIQPAQTAEVASAPPEEPDLVDSVHLSALWTQNGTTLLLVNDNIHNVGDTIGRLKIDSASPKGIWLSHAKGRTFLEVGKSFVLKTPVRHAAKKSSQSAP